MEYSQAEKFLEKAINKSPYMQRAKREMVTVLLAKKYGSALEMQRRTMRIVSKTHIKYMGISDV